MKRKEEEDVKSLNQIDQLGPVDGSPAAVTTQPLLSNPGFADKAKESGSSSGEEKELDEGWQVFRARKKSSSGSGSPPKSKTRIRFHEVKGKSVGISGVGGVSTSYWAATAHGSSSQVCQPTIGPSLEKYSNCKSGARKDSCPVSILEKGKKRKDSIGGQPVLEDCPRPEILNVSGAPPKSSAGHTPFPSRLSIMARDLRLGKVGSGHFCGPKKVSQNGLADTGPNVKSQSQEVPAGLDLGALNGSNGPAIGAENEIIPGCLKSTSKYGMDHTANEPTFIDSLHEINGSLQPDSGKEDELPNGFFGPNMQLSENPDIMGYEELGNQMKKGVRMSSDKGYIPTSSR